jgi:hypothetical protein
MSLITNCPRCGKQVAYPASRAGSNWMCAACGAMVELPANAPPVPIPALPPSAAEPPPPEPQSEPAPSPINPMLPWLVLLGVVIFLQFILIIWQFASQSHATWEQLNRQTILDMKAEAERLAGQGNWAEAYEHFRDLDRFVTGNQITDPDLRTALQTAQDEENDTFHHLFNQTLADARGAATRATSLPAAAPASPPPAAPVVVVAAPPGPPQLHRPAVHPLPDPAVIVDDARIGRAISAAVQYLAVRFEKNQIQNTTPYFDAGVDALAVYALLQAYDATGDSRLDPRRSFMGSALDALKKLPMDNSLATYGRSLRANALSLADRPEDREALQADMQWLLATGPHGAFTYATRSIDRAENLTNYIWDNSNSQYGLLGVWAAADYGLNVPRSFWQAAQNHWLSTQLPDGRWGYAPGDQDPRRSMTLAGIASLFVTEDYLQQGRPIAEDHPNASLADQALPPALLKSMDWLESGDNAVVPFNDGFFSGYTVFGLERVGLASGYKYFGSHDWYRESAINVLDQAGPDGGWGDPVRTSFALLFLARGRHPLVMNKVRYDGDWNDHPRDVANLSHYVGHMLERQLNWQVVPLQHDWTDWSDAPILFITGHDKPNIQPAEEQKLRQFVLNGGLLVTQADSASDTGGKPSAAFTQWAMDLGTRIFPPYQWQDLPADHPLWTALLKLKNPLAVKGLGNGARLFMVHLSDDVSSQWQVRSELSHPDEFALGLDLFLYATGRTDLQNRLVSRAIAPVTDPPAASIDMTQLTISADSDPEPAAWPRFALWFRRQTNLGIKFVSRPLESLKPGDSPIAHLTGVQRFSATDARCTALARYVSAGGVVLIDPCGGPNDFLASVRDDLLPRAFPSASLVRLDSTHPLLTSSGDGMAQLWPLDVRDYVRGLSTPIDRGIWVLRSGKGAVVLSSLDITSGLLGTNTWGIAGFTSEYSLALAKNFVLWAWDGAQDQ